MSVRSELRAVVFEWAQNRCEHPLYVGPAVLTRTLPAPLSLTVRCLMAAKELAHIYPRGMGHTGYRDTLDNVMAACTLHARSTDDMSSPEWLHVPAPHDRKALYGWIQEHRADWPQAMEEQ